MDSASSFNVAGLIVVLLGCIFALLGLGLLAFAVINRRKATASQNWPSVPGQVVSSSVQRNTHRDTDGDTSYTYQPQIEYTYAVGEQTFTGKRISFGSESSSNPRKAEQVADQYKMGTPVTVYYDPAKPQDATLQKTAAGSWVGIIVGIVFVVVSCCMCGFGATLLSRILG